MHDRDAEGVATRSGGMNGSGGAIWNAGNAPYSSGAVCDEVAEEPQQVGGVVELVEEQPDVDVLDRVQLELEVVTTPKLPPPPRSAQNRSAFSFSLAVRTRPSAVTTSAERRLSIDRP